MQLNHSIYSAQTNEQAIQFESLIDRLGRYSFAHKRTLAMIDFLKSAVNDAAYSYSEHCAIKTLLRQISSCGHWLIFSKYSGQKNIQLDNADFCKKHIICPLCAARRASKVIDRFKERYIQVQNGGFFTTKGKYKDPTAHRTLKPYMLTLTVRNSFDVLEGFDHLRIAFNHMKKQRNKVLSSRSATHQHSQLAGIEAMLYAYEITKGAKGWHPHVHSLILCEPSKLPDFPINGTAKQKKASGLAKEWLHYTGNSYIVDLKPIDDIDRGLQEVLKYFVKFGDLSLEENLEVFLELGGKHFIGSLGYFYGVANLSDDEKDVPNLEGLDFQSYYFKYLRGKYKQVDYLDELVDYMDLDRASEFAEYEKIDEKIRLGELPSDFWETVPKSVLCFDDSEIPF